MRALIATDGSEAAQAGLDLAAGMDWPADAVLRVVTVVEPTFGLYGAPWAPALPAHVDRLEQELVAHSEGLLESASRMLARTGRTIETQLVRGRAASSIVDAAVEFGAELLTVGSRGHGAIVSMVLGSVSAEVIDHAPCPVLLARRSTLTRVVLGHDGSDYATAAERVVARWPMFATTAVEVVSVAPVGAPWGAGSAPTIYAEMVQANAERVAAATAEHRLIAEEAVQRLTLAGRRASASVLAGDPAATLVQVADDRQADLIVIGTHGRTGLTRALLGSVARNVVQHATCSVLVVRGRPTDDPEQRAVEAAIGGGAGSGAGG